MKHKTLNIAVPLIGKLHNIFRPRIQFSRYEIKIDFGLFKTKMLSKFELNFNFTENVWEFSKSTEKKLFEHRGEILPLKLPQNHNNIFTVLKIKFSQKKWGSNSKFEFYALINISNTSK